jgi:alpha-L-fucosidase
MNDAWAYRRDDSRWKTTEQLVRMLVNVVSKGGNLLLNVGPTGRGDFPKPSLERLAGIAAWMRAHGRAIYGCGPSAFTPPPDARYTQRGDRLYLHLFAWPFQHVHLPGMAGVVEYAQLLNDASEVGLVTLPPGAEAGLIHPGGQPEGTLTLKLPVQRPDVALPVVELFLGPGS